MRTGTSACAADRPAAVPRHRAGPSTSRQTMDRSNNFEASVQLLSPFQGLTLALPFRFYIVYTPSPSLWVGTKAHRGAGAFPATGG